MAKDRKLPGCEQEKSRSDRRAELRPINNLPRFVLPIAAPFIFPIVVPRDIKDTLTRWTDTEFLPSVRDRNSAKEIRRAILSFANRP